MASLCALVQQASKRNISSLAFGSTFLRRYPNFRHFSTENQKDEKPAQEKTQTSSYEYKANKDYLTYEKIMQQKEQTKRKTSPFRTILKISTLALTAWASYDLSIAYMNYRLGEQVSF